MVGSAMMRQKVKFRRPKLDRAAWKNLFRLPSHFCGTCSLREGSAVIIVLIQLSMAGILATSLCSLLVFPDAVTKFWQEKLTSDFSKWFRPKDKPEEYGKRHNETWMTIAWSFVGASSGYGTLGFSIVYAVIFKSAHPIWFLPWLLCSFILILATYAVTAAMTAFIVIFVLKREVTITMDVVPIVFVLVFVIVWNYGFIIVLAHAKKRYLSRKLIHAAKLARKNKGAASMSRRPPDTSGPGPGPPPPTVTVVASQKEGDKTSTAAPSKPSTVPTLPPLPMPTVRLNSEPMY